MKSKIQLLLLTSILLSGCELLNEQRKEAPVRATKLVNTEPVCVTSTGMVAKCKSNNQNKPRQMTSDVNVSSKNVAPLPSARPYRHSLENARSSVMLGEYIEQLSMELISHLDRSKTVPLVGVTSIVEVSNNLSTITPLSNVLTEEFITELQHKNIYVVDYKITNNITVSPYGEFVFYRNSVEELSEEKINHVLAGTLSYTKQGIIVNARVVEFESKKVISSAKKLIPYFVFDSVITS